MRAYRQFITYKLVSRPNNKTDKLPTDWRTGEVIDAQDPQYWTGCDDCTPAGFVLTDSDPYFCLDIDNCLQPDNTWSPLALEVVNAFPGAMVEVSQSGRGLHIWGRYTEMPPHSCKNAALGLELYHTGRFIALGHPNSVGDPERDCTAFLPAVIAKWFTPSKADMPAEWTDGPVAQWRGPTDDDELIRRALRSGSTAAAFGARARFIDLWERNVDVLSAAYPSTDDRDYDESSADMALSAHLRFWTGGDCERIARLLKRSGLTRDKHERDDYVRRTVLAACALGGDVLCDQPSTAESEAECVQELNAEIETVRFMVPERRVGSTFATADDQMKLFQDFFFISDLEVVFTRDGRMLGQTAFNNWYDLWTFQKDNNNDGKAKDAWSAFVKSQCVKFNRTQTSCFRPDLPPRGVIKTVRGWDSVNTYLPLKVPRIKGDPAPFLDLLRRMLPNERDQAILLAYMAAVVQHAGVKFLWAPLLQGVEGNGKTTICQCVAEAVGRDYWHPARAAFIAQNFNSWMYRKVFYTIDDIYLGDSQKDVIEQLKPMITEKYIEVEFKGRDKASLQVCGNFILTTNHKDGVRKTRSDRRFAPFFMAQQDVGDLRRDGLTGEYFRGLYKWLAKEGFAIVSEFLYTYHIPDELNPALGGRAPNTSSTEEAIRAGMGRIEQEVLECVERGEPGFRGGWVSSLALDELLTSKRLDIARAKRRDLLRSLGYDWHPAFPDGRVFNPILDVNRQHVKPKLFIKRDHLACNLQGGGEVVKAYQDAQKIETGGDECAGVIRK